jgi:hypothetical protein
MRMSNRTLLTASSGGEFGIALSLQHDIELHPSAVGAKKLGRILLERFHER